MTVSLIRTIILYSFVIIAVRIMGKRQVGELQNSELVITLLISNLAAIPMQDASIPLISGLIPIFVLVICEVLVSYAMLWSKKIRDLICGHPIPIVKNGKILQKNMIKIRFTAEDLCESLRLKDCFNLSDVEFATVETNGKLSLFIKNSESPATKKDIGIKDNSDNIYFPVVAQGKICQPALTVCNKSEKWIDNILKKENHSIEQIYLMTANKSGDYVIINKEP